MYGLHKYFTTSTNTDTLGCLVKAAVYYCEHFQFIKTVIDEFEENNGITIRKVQKLIADKKI